MADNFTLNLANVDENAQYEILPPGTYPCTVENTEYGPSSNGNPMITWQFRVVHPEYENKFLWLHTVLNNDAGLRRLKKMLLVTCPEMTQEDLEQFNPDDFCAEGKALGAMCMVKVKNRMYQGKPTNNVQDVEEYNDMSFMGS